MEGVADIRLISATRFVGFYKEQLGGKGPFLDLLYLERQGFIARNIIFSDRRCQC